MTYVAPAGRRNRGLHSTRACKAGDAIASGRALCAAQFLGNPVSCCEFCGAFVGPLSQQLLLASGCEVALPHIEGVPSATGSVSCTQGCGAIYCSDRCRDQDGAHVLLCVPADCEAAHPAARHLEVLTAAAESEVAVCLPLAARAIASAAFEAASAGRRYDRVLDSAVGTFEAMATGGVWAEVGRQYGGVRGQPGHFSEDEEEEGSEDNAEGGGEEQEDDDAEEEDDDDGVEEVLSTTSGGEEDAEGAATEEVSLLLEQGWTWLCAALEARLPPSRIKPAILGRLQGLGAGWYAGIVGTFERCAIPISAPSPLQRYLEALPSAPLDIQRAALSVLEPIAERLEAEKADGAGEAEALGREAAEDPREGRPAKRRKAKGGAEAGDEATRARVLRLIRRETFPRLEGLALFHSSAALNHSCDPNCEWRWEAAGGAGGGGGSGGPAAGGGWRGWHSASLRVLRPIDEEGELTISYVDAACPLGERRRALHAAFGFMCRCERCQVQSAQQRGRRLLASVRAHMRDGDRAAAVASFARWQNASRSLGQRALDAGYYDEAVQVMHETDPSTDSPLISPIRSPPIFLSSLICPTLAGARGAARGTPPRPEPEGRPGAR